MLTRLLAVAAIAAACACAQPPPIGIPHVALGAGPFTFDTAEQHKIRVTVVARGIVASLEPGVSSRRRHADHRARRTAAHGARRRTRSQASGGRAQGVQHLRNAGFFDLALHPKFAENKLVYFTYSKPRRERPVVATALARGRLDGAGSHRCPRSVHRRTHHRAGRLAHRVRPRRHDLYDHRRSHGHAQRRTPTAITARCCACATTEPCPRTIPSWAAPDTSPRFTRWAIAINWDSPSIRKPARCFTNENGPNGGDEINLILPGRNYGWPLSATAARMKVRGSRSRPGATAFRAAAGHLDPVHRAFRDDVFIPATAFRRGKETSSWAACATARSPAPAAWSAWCSTKRWKSCAANRC